MTTYRPSARAQSTVCLTWAMNAALIVPLVELKSHATGMRRVLNPLSLMESISAFVGGVYPQKESKVFPRLMPGFGRTGAACAGGAALAAKRNSSADIKIFM